MAFRSALPAETPRSKEPPLGSGGPATSKRSKTSSHQTLQNNCWKSCINGVDYGYHPKGTNMLPMKNGWKVLENPKIISMKIIHENSCESKWKSQITSMKNHISCRGNQCEILVFVFSQAGGKKAHFVDLPRLDTKWNLIFKPWKKRAWGNPIIPCSDFFSAPYAHGVFAPEVWGIEYTQNKPQKLQLQDLF